MGFRPCCGEKWSSGPDLHRPLAIIGRLLCCLSYRREIGTAPGNRTLPVGFGDQPVPLNICAVWCPRPVARRLPLFGRQPCIYEHLSGELGGAGRLRSVASALRVRRAAIGTTAPEWTRRRDSHPRTSALQAGPLAARARRDRKENRGSGHSASEDFSNVRPQ